MTRGGRRGQALHGAGCAQAKMHNRTVRSSTPTLRRHTHTRSRAAPALARRERMLCLARIRIRRTHKPSSHGVHTTVPLDGAWRPAAQSSHSECGWPSLPVNFPRGQCAQADQSPSEYLRVYLKVEPVEGKKEHGGERCGTGEEEACRQLLLLFLFARGKGRNVRVRGGRERWRGAWGWLGGWTATTKTQR